MAKQSNQGVIVITGASRGLGLGLACVLAAQQVPLLLVARSADRLEKLGRRLGDFTRVEFAPADVTNQTAMALAFERVPRLGPLAGLVNNAGVLTPVTAVRSVPVQAFMDHQRTNVAGALIGMQEALRARTAQQPLRIVNVSSGAALTPYRGWGAYCASKAALTMLTQVAAKEESDGRTSIVAVAPGVIETDMQRAIRAVPEQDFPDVQRFHELKQRGLLQTPADAAVALAWLVLEAPLALSGQFIDARSPEVQAQVQVYRAQHQEALETAEAWFQQLEAI